jgi:hypothetical protein
MAILSRILLVLHNCIPLDRKHIGEGQGIILKSFNPLILPGFDKLKY